MTERTASRLAWSLWGVAVVLLIVNLVLSIAAGVLAEEGVFVFVYPIVPPRVLDRRRVHRRAPAGQRDRMGVLRDRAWPGRWAASRTRTPRTRSRSVAKRCSLLGRPTGSTSGSTGPRSSCPVTLLLLLFPDGRLPSPRWRPFLWLAIVGSVGIFARERIRPGHRHGRHSVPHVEPLRRGGLGRCALDPRHRSPSSPRSWPSFASPGRDGASDCVVARRRATSADLAGVRRRPRRARDRRHDRRRLDHGLGVRLDRGADRRSSRSSRRSRSSRSRLGSRILKYRLYDIDVVINRTVVYGSLAAIVTAIYVAIVVGIGTSSAAAGTCSCRRWPPRSWRSCSNRSADARSTSRTASSTASAQRLTRCCRGSPTAWRTRTRSTTSCPRLTRVLGEGIGARADRDLPPRGRPDRPDRVVAQGGYRRVDTVRSFEVRHQGEPLGRSVS